MDVQGGILVQEEEMYMRKECANGGVQNYIARWPQFFKMCNEGKYETIGDDVNYAFNETPEGILYILFQPSRGKADWRNNFAYWRKPYKDMRVKYRVHGGFLKCWKSVEDIVRTKVKERGADGAYKWRKIVIIGYSHGAALAAFCHECVWFEREDLREEGLWGFGFEGPRIYGGLRLKRALRNRWEHFYMTRNDEDIVTHVPFKCMWFSHVGNLVQVGDGSCKGHPVKAHYPQSVLRALEEYASRFEVKDEE